MDQLDPSGNAPLHWAAAAGSTDVGRLLLDEGADINIRGVGGNQAVHVAAAHGRMGFIQLCLAYGADLDSTNMGKGGPPANFTPRL